MNFAVIGGNIQNSLSPIMHQWIYDSLGLDYRYKAIDITLNRVDSIVNKLRNQALNGVNVTIPFKRAFVSYLDEVDSLASKIGAINCIHSYNGVLRGYNTDYYGFKKLISYNNVDLKNKKILVLGAGGASRAICVYLANNNNKFFLGKSSKIKGGDCSILGLFWDHLLKFCLCQIFLIRMKLTARFSMNFLQNIFC